MRTLIIGNCGSGKTWLAKRLTARTGAYLVHLDELAHEPGTYSRRIDSKIAGLIAAVRTHPAWVVEGIYADLAELLLDDAQRLIWLDLDWPTCRARLEHRQPECAKDRERGDSEDWLASMLWYAEDYYHRAGPSSQAAHLALWSKSGQRGSRLRSPHEVDDFLASVRQGL